MEDAEEWILDLVKHCLQQKQNFILIRFLNGPKLHKALEIDYMTIKDSILKMQDIIAFLRLALARHYYYILFI